MDDISKNYYFKYLPAAPRDRDWGWHVSAVGSSRVQAHEHYPPAPHPCGYDYEWPQDRVLQEFQCIYITRGQGTFQTRAAGRHKIKAGSLFFLFPDQPHRYTPDPETGWDDHWVSFDGNIPRQFLKKGILSLNRPVYAVGLNPSILRCYQNILDVVKAQAPGYSPIAAMLTAQLVAQAQATTGKVDAPAQQRMRMAMFRIEVDVDRSINFEELANELHMGYSPFRRQFKRYAGLSPKQYHIQLRISRAKSLLTNTTLNIKEIASAMSFESPYYFMRFFKQRTEMSPTAWRHYSRGDTHL
jgi:AraC-like DNA-binding protein